MNKWARSNIYFCLHDILTECYVTWYLFLLRHKWSCMHLNVLYITTIIFICLCVFGVNVNFVSFAFWKRCVRRYLLIYWIKLLANLKNCDLQQKNGADKIHEKCLLGTNFCIIKKNFTLLICPILYKCNYNVVFEH